MQPEISRRCLSCGAAVRAGARFCPQWGQVMAEGGGAPATPARAASTDTPADASTDASAPAGAAPPARDFETRREAAPATRDVEAPREPVPPRRTEQPPPRSEPARQPEQPRTSEPARALKTTQDWAPPTKEYAAFMEAVEGGARGGVVEAPRAGDGADGASEAAAAEGAEATTAEGESEGARAAGRVARVRGEARARVGRMRDEAIVVLEETPDDSGLRFVVAAAALFFVFVLLLFLSIYVLR